MKDTCVCVVVVVVIIIVILIGFCVLKSSQQHESTLKIIGVKAKKTNALPIIAGTATGAVLLTGSVVGLTINSLNSSMGANILKALNIKSGNASLNEMEGGSVIGDWKLYKNITTNKVELYNQKIMKTLAKFFKELGWKEDEAELLQSGQMVQQDEKTYYIMTENIEGRLTKKYTTDPFLYIEEKTKMSINDDGQLVVPIKQDIEEFAEQANQVVETVANATGESLDELLDEIVVTILGDDFVE